MRLIRPVSLLLMLVATSSGGDCVAQTPTRVEQSVHTRWDDRSGNIALPAMPAPHAATEQSVRAKPTLLKGGHRIETRLHSDSTQFELTLPQHAVGKGQRFTVKLHVGLKKGWRVYSSHCPECQSMTPLQIKVQDSMSDLIDLVSLRETGRIDSTYDSDWDAHFRYHTEPFDVIATLTAKRAVRSLKDFRLYVGYQAVNDSSNMCLPPFWYEVRAGKHELVTN